MIKVKKLKISVGLIGVLVFGTGLGEVNLNISDGINFSDENSDINYVESVINNNKNYTHFKFKVIADGLETPKYNFIGRVEVDDNISNFRDCGTGFLVADNVVITNRHVIERDLRNGKSILHKPKNIQFKINTFTGYRSFTVKEFKALEDSDLAILRLESDVNFSYVKLPIGDINDINRLKVGDKLYSSGYPVYHQDNDRKYENQSTYISKSVDAKVFYSKGRLDGGMSGSPVITEDGKLVGAFAYTTKADLKTKDGIKYISSGYLFNEENFKIINETIKRYKSYEDEITHYHPLIKDYSKDYTYAAG